METITATLSSECTIQGNISSSDIIVGELYLPSISSSSQDIYMGDYIVIPKPREAQTLQTTNKLLIDDIVVKEIPFYKVSNNNGNTVYIGREV